MVPFILAATSLWVTGFFVDRLCKSAWYQWSRRLPAMVGFALAAGGMVGMTSAPNATWAVLYLTIAIYGIEMTIPPSWTHCVDIAGTSSGAISGTMNGVGNLGSFLWAAAFSWLTAHYGRNAYFWVAGALNLAGLFLWFWIVPRKGKAVKHLRTAMILRSSFGRSATRTTNTSRACGRATRS
jgi:ACS family glucarate transporter-like MFS transporter